MKINQCRNFKNTKTFLASKHPKITTPTTTIISIWVCVTPKKNP